MKIMRRSTPRRGLWRDENVVFLFMALGGIAIVLLVGLTMDALLPSLGAD
jgi:hypothetical protein